MTLQYQGEIAALITAFCWTATSLSFEAAGKRVGSLSVNLIRLVLAMFFLMAFGWIARGLPLPTDATQHAWIWLGVSGLIGFVFGDLCLFRAFVVIGPRLAMLIMALAPPITALIGWLLLGEKLNAIDWIAMALTVSGVIWVVLERAPVRDGVLSHLSPWGVTLAFFGAIGQATGLVLSKYGMGDYDPFAATQIRIMAGIVGFAVLFVAIRWWGRVFEALKNGPAMGYITIGSIAGPFLGVSFSLMAVKYTQTGVAATIMSTVPIIIIPAVILIHKEKVSARATVGAVLAVSGVALLFLQ